MIINLCQHEAKWNEQNGLYGYVIIFEGFVSSISTDGSLYSFGIFFSEYVRDFGSSLATTSWIGSTAASCHTLFAFHVGYLCDLYGFRVVMLIGALLSGISYLISSYCNTIWQLILSQGILYGIGASFAFNSGLPIVGQWFSKRRGFAFGIAGSGSGIGQFIFSLLTGYFISEYGWRLALRYLALIIGGSLLLCALMMRNIHVKDEISRNTPKVRPNLLKSLMELCNDRYFFLLYVGYVFVSFGFSMPYAYIPIYAQTKGMSINDSYFLLSIVGLSSTFGRIAIGYLADIFGRLFMIRISILISAIFTFLWIDFDSFSTLLLYSILLYLGFLLEVL